MAAYGYEYKVVYVSSYDTTARLEAVCNDLDAEGYDIYQIMTAGNQNGAGFNVIGRKDKKDWKP